MSLERISLSIALLFLVITGPLNGQENPYLDFPEANAPYYRVRYEAQQEETQLEFAVNYTVWIPPETKRLRGLIVHQHGCGVGSCKSGLTGAYDLHWQALARAHGCALLSPAYEQPAEADCQLWCDPRNGSDKSFQKALVDLGKQSDHPELSIVPWALWGHSGGGTWAGAMAILHPDRVAAAWLRSGVPRLSAVPNRPKIKPHQLGQGIEEVPLLCNLGTKEGVSDTQSRFAGVWPAVQAFFGPIRSRGGRIGIAVDPLTSHECGNQRYLAIPWLDACLKLRLPQDESQRLRSIPIEQGYLATALGKEAVPFEQFKGTINSAVWLPNKEVALAWEEYVEDSDVQDDSPPPAPKSVRVNGNRLTWQADADLQSGLAGFIIERDGEVIAKLPERPRNPYGRPLFQKLLYSDTPEFPLAEMTFIDSTATDGRVHQYQVIALNTKGQRSLPASAESSSVDVPRR